VKAAETLAFRRCPKRRGLVTLVRKIEQQLRAAIGRALVFAMAVGAALGAALLLAGAMWAYS
jgi:hypothetical protein